MLQIGFMARLQITHGAEDTREMRKAVCELRIQAYNSKLKTPAGKTTHARSANASTRPPCGGPAFCHCRAGLNILISSGLTSMGSRIRVLLSTARR